MIFSSVYSAEISFSIRIPYIIQLTASSLFLPSCRNLVYFASFFSPWTWEPSSMSLAEKERLTTQVVAVAIVAPVTTAATLATLEPAAAATTTTAAATTTKQQREKSD